MSLKIIHTADWHLGVNFYNYDRQHEHGLFLEWLKLQIATHQIDLLLLSGDVFDSPNPSAESQKMLYHFLYTLSQVAPSLSVIITAGNHDSAARLEAPSILTQHLNTHIVGNIKYHDGHIDLKSLIIPINDSQGEVKAIVLAVPYLRQGDYPRPSEGEASTHEAGTKRLYTQLIELARTTYGDQVPLIGMGHFQAQGGTLSENDRSERTIIGGLEAIDSSTFGEAMNYLALGHLHRPQIVAKKENIRYSGTPFAISFSEENTKHGVMKVEIKPDENSYEYLSFNSPVKLISIPKRPQPIDQVLEEISKLEDGEITEESPFVQIKVVNDSPDPSRKHKIEEALTGKNARLTSIISQAVTTNRQEEEHFQPEGLDAITPFDLASQVYERQFGQAMPEHMSLLLTKVIHELQQEEK